MFIAVAIIWSLIKTTPKGFQYRLFIINLIDSNSLGYYYYYYQMNVLGVFSRHSINFHIN